MKKVLLVDTNISSYPIYSYLKSRGLEVYVIGGNPEDSLAKISENYIEADYSDLDLLRNIMADYKFEYLVPGCNDQSYYSCALLNEEKEFDYPGIDDFQKTTLLNNKVEFRRLALRLNLSSPKIYNVDDIDKDNLPVIIKPVDSYSGKGISVIKEGEFNKVSAAIKKAQKFSPSDSFIIEEYFEGQLFSCSAMLTGGNVVADFIVKEYGTTNKFAVDVSYLESGNLIDKKKLQTEIELLADELEISNGLIHVQFIFKDGIHKIIEATRRCPGDLYSLLIEYSTNYKYAECYTGVFLGEKPIRSNLDKEKKHIVRVTLNQSEPQHLGGIEFSIPLKIKKIFSLKCYGTLLTTNKRFALLFIECKDDNEMEEIVSIAQKQNLYKEEL